MMDLYYTLAEAAQKLNFSEAVLFRLSQSFKVPQIMGRKEGTITESDKEDLLFNGNDLSFFQKVRDSLLSGSTLEQIKQTLVPPAGKREQDGISSDPHGTASSPYGSGASASSPSNKAHFGVGSSPPMGGRFADSMARAAALVDIPDAAPYKNTAAKALKDYKRTHHPSESKIFENLLKTDLFTAPIPTAKPSELSSVSHTPRPYGTKPSLGNPLMSKEKEPSWQKLLAQTIQQPRILNSQLKNAAMLLKEQTLGGGNHNPKLF